jgi:hypothetical protein
MRELVYLSDRKLRQFLPDPKPRWRRLGRLRAEVKAPLGSVSVEPASPEDAEATAAHLQRVVAHVERSAQWFTSETLVAGEWIYFEDRLHYGVFGHGVHGLYNNDPDPNSALLFINARRPGIGQTRLLLHGSPEHLLVDWTRSDRLRREWVSPSDGYLFIDLVRLLPGMIEDLNAGVGIRPPEPGEDFRPTREGPPWALEGQIKDVVNALDKRDDTVAAWMAGYARVTAKLSPSPIVVATPLYVERRPSSRKDRHLR